MIIGNPITLGGGGSSGPVGRSDVNFFDYDGTLVASYTAAEFAGLSAMPKNPSHDGLTAQGWNYTLSDAKAYVASYGKLDVGQMYVTDDGKTRIYIKLEEGRLAPYLGLAVNGTATVEWGDGQTSTVTGSDLGTVVSTQHTYASAGEYVIKIAVSGSMALIGDSFYGSQVLWKNSTTATQNRVYQNAIQKVEVGANTSIDNYAFRNCYALASVTLSNGMTYIGNYAFNSCYVLTSVVIPNGVTSISAYAFQYCYSLASVVIPSSVTDIGTYAFSGCRALASVVIPDSVTDIRTYAFNSCYALTSVVIPNSVTYIGTYTFTYCYSLASIVIPSGVLTIGNNTFLSCFSLTTVVIPSSMVTIGGSAFYGCSSLASVVIPDSVTSISNQTFRDCYGLGFLKFTRATPPTVSNVNSWANVPPDCIIYVPRGSLAAYTSAANYPSSSTYTYVEYDP